MFEINIMHLQKNKFIFFACDMMVTVLEKEIKIKCGRSNQVSVKIVNLTWKDKDIYLLWNLLRTSSRKNAAKAMMSNCSVLGEDTVLKNICEYWFRRFKTGSVDISDQ